MPDQKDRWWDPDRPRTAEERQLIFSMMPPGLPDNGPTFKNLIEAYMSKWPTGKPRTIQPPSREQGPAFPETEIGSDLHGTADFPVIRDRFGNVISPDAGGIIDENVWPPPSINPENPDAYHYNPGLMQTGTKGVEEPPPDYYAGYRPDDKTAQKLLEYLQAQQAAQSRQQPAQPTTQPEQPPPMPPQGNY